MSKDQAEATFNEVRAKLGSTMSVPMNKQTDQKANPAYLTGIVHMLIDAHIRGLPCDYDPQSLTTFVREGEPVAVLSRRMDGLFHRPSIRSRYGNSRNTTTQRHSEAV